MQTNSFLPENRTFRKETSSENSAVDTRKRRRKVLSCYDCRRRKLQCDRVQPACSRCIKAGNATTCLYIEDAEIPGREQKSSAFAEKTAPFYRRSTQVSPTADDALADMGHPERRVKQPGGPLARSTGGLGITQGQIGNVQTSLPDFYAAAVGTPTPEHDRDDYLLRGRDFKTQFHGNTHPCALIAHISELSTFSKETFELYPALLKFRKEMQALEARRIYADSERGSFTDTDLRALLPSKAEADGLIRIYLQNYSSIYQVIHLPSFEEEYKALWSGNSSTRAHFVAIVLCITASVRCLTATQPWLYRASSSVAREKAVSAIHGVENWLVSQSQKHVTAADFQIRVLVMFAKQTCARKPKRIWTEMGDLIRFCMAAGLHRSPDLLRKPTSLLEKELRKRVWAAVSEMELQAAFDRGMVSTPWMLQSDCPPPLHINDEDIDETTTQLPAQRRSNEFTGVSYLATANQSIMLRTYLNTKLNNIRQSISFDDARKYTDEVEVHLSSLPQWTEPCSEVSKAMLVLNLHQYMLVLHDRQIRQAERQSERDYSRMMVINTATRIMDKHRSLTSKGCYALELLRSDQIRAALSICHVLAVADPRADDALSVAVEHVAARVIPDAIDMLTHKVLCIGREQRQLWTVVAASSCMKCKSDSSRRLAHMQDAVDQVTLPYDRILACQEGINTNLHPQTSDEHLGRRMSNGTISATGKQALEYDLRLPQAQDFQAPAGFDFDELTAWTFDDFAFDPVHLP